MYVDDIAILTVLVTNKCCSTAYQKISPSFPKLAQAAYFTYLQSALTQDCSVGEKR